MSQERIKKDYPKTFTRNMERLQELQPKLAERIYDFVEENGFPQPSVKETPAGLWCSGLGGRPFFQLHLSEKTFIPRKKRERPRPVVMIYGIGYPPYLVQMLRSIDKSVLAVIIFEPSLEILVYTFTLSSVYDALPQFARVSFVLEDERIFLDEALHVNVSPLGTFPVTQADIIEHSGEREIFQKEIVALVAEFRKAVRISVEKLGNTAEDTLVGVRNICLNAPYIWHTPSLEDLAKKYEGIPVITVASGPSLEKNFSLLKGLGGRCLIVCADTALPKLLREDIIPHIVVTLERPFRMYLDYFRPLYEEHYDKCKNILLLAEGVSPSQVVGRWPGAIGVIGKYEIPVDQWIIKETFGGNTLYSGASVMHVALSFAAFCKASSVAMIGQDLAYSKEGASHSSGIVSLADEKTEQSRMISGYDVPGIYGETVRTSISWLKMLQIFEDMIASFPCKVFDCTEGGAKIEGTEILDFSDYIEKYLENREPFDVLPCAFFLQKQEELLPTEKAEAISFRLARLFDTIEELRELLRKMEQTMKKGSAPGLTSSLRREIALDAAEKLDSFHKKNSAVAFIGQSYAYATGSAFALYRFMEFQEEIEHWQKAWGELLEAHKKILGFLNYWFEYLSLAIKWYASFPSSREFLETVHPCLEKESRKFSLDFFGEASFLEFENEAIPTVTSFLARTDAYKQGWDPLVMWRGSLFLEQQGRFEQASLFMEEAAEIMEGQEVSEQTLGNFLFDYARLLSKEDLCHFPKYRKSLSILNQAKQYLGEEFPKIGQLSLSIRTAYGKALLRYKEAVITPYANTNPEMAFREVVMNVERLLTTQRLDLALRAVWSGIVAFGEQVPQDVRPHFLWLLNLIPKTIHAQDDMIKEASLEILDSIAVNLSLLEKIRVPLSMELIALLEEQGISFASSSQSL